MIKRIKYLYEHTNYHYLWMACGISVIGALVTWIAYSGLMISLADKQGLDLILYVVFVVCLLWSFSIPHPKAEDKKKKAKA